MPTRGSKVVPFFVKGKGFIARPRPSRLKVSDEQLVELRLKYIGSTGRPGLYCPGGLDRIAKIVGFSRRTVGRRLNKIAEREES